MRRFVFRYQGKGAAPAADLVRVRAAGRVLDEADARMFLVELEDGVAGELARRLSGWLLVPEASVPRPEPRARVQRPPSRKAAKPA